MDSLCQTNEKFLKVTEYESKVINQLNIQLLSESDTNNEIYSSEPLAFTENLLTKMHQKITYRSPRVFK